MDITIGGSANSGLLASILPAIVAAAAALAGAYLSDRQHARRSADERARDLEARQGDRQLAALALAEALEDFVIHSVDVVASHRWTSWDADPNAEYDVGDGPVWFKKIEGWPDLVDWRLVGFDVAVQASNLRRLTDFARTQLSGASEYVDAEDLHELHAEAAAEYGLQAWDLATHVRTANKLAAFAWPEAAYYDVTTMKTFLTALRERRAEGSDPTDC